MIIDPATVPANINYRILVGAVVPRPIAFVSTVSTDGVYNLAPFSFFNVVCGDPPVVCFSPIWRNPPKDTIVNIRATGEFVVNIVSEEFVEKMNVCSGEFPSNVDEFTMSGLTPVASDVVRRRACRNRTSTWSAGCCRLSRSARGRWAEASCSGEVVRFHVDDAVSTTSRITRSTPTSSVRSGA